MLGDIKKTLWAAADKRRANMDAAEYKHLVLGLIFLNSHSRETHPAPRPRQARKAGCDLRRHSAGDEPDQRRKARAKAVMSA